MILIPAIDIKGGKVVRLAQGKLEKETVYFDSPLKAAMLWAKAGAEFMHIVDLDGAIEGRLKNLDSVREILKHVKVKVELGGGIRDEETIRSVLDAGVDKVVIGTKALEDDFIFDIAKKFGERIVVGIDAKNGIVQTKGWVCDTGAEAVDLAKRIAALGIKTINYTDISRDGMLQGPNAESLKKLLGAVKIDVIASGGISTIDDVKRLKALEPEGLKGIIIGKALYERVIDLKEAIAVCKGQGLGQGKEYAD